MPSNIVSLMSQQMLKNGDYCRLTLGLCNFSYEVVSTERYKLPSKTEELDRISLASYAVHLRNRLGNPPAKYVCVSERQSAQQYTSYRATHLSRERTHNTTTPTKTLNSSPYSRLDSVCWICGRQVARLLCLHTIRSRRRDDQFYAERK